MRVERTRVERRMGVLIVCVLGSGEDVFGCDLNVNVRVVCGFGG